jgi:hypothetical protein
MVNRHPVQFVVLMAAVGFGLGCLTGTIFSNSIGALGFGIIIAGVDVGVALGMVYRTRLDQ